MGKKKAALSSLLNQIFKRADATAPTSFNAQKFFFFTYIGPCLKPYLGSRYILPVSFKHVKGFRRGTVLKQFCNGYFFHEIVSFKLRQISVFWYELVGFSANLSPEPQPADCHGKYYS